MYYEKDEIIQAKPLVKFSYSQRVQKPMHEDITKNGKKKKKTRANISLSMGSWLNKLHTYSVRWNYDAAVKKKEPVLFIKI